MKDPFEEGPNKNPEAKNVNQSRMIQMREFFSAQPDIDYAGHSLEEAFTTEEYAHSQFLLDLAEGAVDLEEMEPEKIKGVGMEYAVRYKEDIEWLEQQGLVERVGEDSYRLTEGGRAVLGRAN